MSVDVHGLPSPSSGDEEVRFRRFLLKCYERVEQSEDDAWKRDPVFHRYVEDLQDQLGRIRNREKEKIPAELVARYVLHVDHLSNSLLTPDIPLYCKTLPRNTTTTTTTAAAVASTSTAGPSSSGSKLISEKPDVYRNLGRMVQRSNLGDEAKTKLEMHAQIQESLTDDLLKLAQDLKSKTQSMESALHKRDAAMDATTDALEFSAAAAKDASSRASKQYKTSRMGTCRMLLILLLVGFVFTGMIFFIRVTTFVGYRSRKEEL